MKMKNFLKKFGPGLVTGASDDDPSGIATYSQAGAKFGLSLLWTALLTYPLMYSIQEMCARIGMVAGKGLTKTIKDNYSKPFCFILILLTFPAVTFNIAADLAGMGAVGNLLFPNFSPFFYSTLFASIIIVCLISLQFNKMSMILKWLCLSLLGYLIVPFLVKTDWLDVFKHLIKPTIQFDKDYIEMFVAILGTTISPYLFFWQSSMSEEHFEHNGSQSFPDELKIMRADVNVGMLLSNLVMFFIILATATVLFPAGIHNIDTVEQAASALKPLAGELSHEIFSLGIIGTGFLAIPVLAGSLGYIFADVFNWKQGMDKYPHQAWGFYAVIIISILLGLLITYFGIDPIKSLIFTAVIYGLTAPFLIAFILLIANSKKIMGAYVNNRFANLTGWLTFIVMTFAALAYVYQFI